MNARTFAIAGTSIALTVLLSACGSTTGEGPAGSGPTGSSAAVAQAGEATDADISFAQLMIPHHQQAVDMADLALAGATTPEVQQLAEQIQGAQDPEIQMMTGWLEAWGAPMSMGDDHGSHDMGGMTMSGMMTDEDMQALANASGADFDRMWLQMMIAHHQGAIAMADQVKAESTNAEVLALADAVIAGQTAEIDTMTALLAGEPSGAAQDASSVSGAGMAAHIHNISYAGDQLLIGTHDGLWGQALATAPTQVSDEEFDVMGFTSGDDRWLASGHPGEGMDAPADLGLLESTDQGRTWTEVSLGGEVDFHRLVTSGAVVLGLNAHDGRLLRSDDDGATWTDLGVPELFDLAVSPADASVIVGTTESGPVRSTDSGATFEPVAGAPLIALLAWAGDTVYGADVEGGVHQSSDGGSTWRPIGSLPGQPSAFAAQGSSIAALVGNSILESVDGGASFSPRITDLAG